MPRRQAKRQQGEFRGYVEYRFTDEDKKKFKEWLAAEDGTASAILKTIENDYRITLSYDDYNEAYQASISTKDDSSPNAGYVLVGRGADWYKALLQAVYKHYVIMRGDWLNYTKSVSKDWDD